MIRQMPQPLLPAVERSRSRDIALLAVTALLVPDGAFIFGVIFHLVVFPFWMRRVMRQWRALLP